MKREFILQAKTENLNQVLEFVEKSLKEVKCSPKIRTQIQIAVEEIYINIARYAYKSGDGMAVIGIEISGKPLQAVITFTDTGLPYNPLAAKDPDITLSAEERPIGGLGVYMVKKSVDDTEYFYEGGKNIFTIKKILR